ncbi:MAG TPA: hypothetical protein VGG38_19770 [Acidimicrobiales bacterium]|jgi:hypothetical protein
MSEFIEECRREWRRLGVPDPIANEMAADLSADLDEAQAEGGSAEDVLGNSAFDPRRFASSWAVARGVTNQAVWARPVLRRRPVLIGVAAFIGALMVGAALVALGGIHRSSMAVAVAVARPVRVFIPGANRIQFSGPVGPFGGGRLTGLIDPLALLVVVCGVLGLGILAILHWSSWSGFRRFRRHGSGTRNWD